MCSNPIDSLLLPPWLFLVYCLVVLYLFCPNLTFSSNKLLKQSNKRISAAISKYDSAERRRQPHQKSNQKNQTKSVPRSNNSNLKVESTRSNLLKDLPQKKAYCPFTYVKVSEYIDRLNRQQIYQLCQLLNISTKSKGTRHKPSFLKLVIRNFFCHHPHQVIAALGKLKNQPQVQTFTEIKVKPDRPKLVASSRYLQIMNRIDQLTRQQIDRLCQLLDISLQFQGEPKDINFKKAEIRTMFRHEHFKVLRAIEQI